MWKMKDIEILSKLRLLGLNIRKQTIISETPNEEADRNQSGY